MDKNIIIGFVVFLIILFLLCSTNKDKKEHMVGQTALSPQSDIINGIKFSKNWTGYPDNRIDGAEIANDVGGSKKLMIVGNRADGSGIRKVGLWDELHVHGKLLSDQLCMGGLCITPDKFVNLAASVGGVGGVGESGIKLSKAYTGYPDKTPEGAEISNDNANFKKLMIVGNKADNSGIRKVGVWDELQVHGNLRSDNLQVNGKLCIGGRCLSDAEMIKLSNLLQRW